MGPDEGLGRLMGSIPAFADLSQSDRELFAGCAALTAFHSGDYIYKEGEPADFFYVIRHGRVALEVHRPGRPPCIVDSLAAGDLLGWSWLAPPYRLDFGAHALELTRAVRFDAVCLRRKMAEDHSFAYEMYQRLFPVLVRRLVAARRQAVDLYGVPDDRNAAWQ